MQATLGRLKVIDLYGAERVEQGYVSYRSDCRHSPKSFKEHKHFVEGQQKKLLETTENGTVYLIRKKKILHTPPPSTTFTY